MAAVRQNLLENYPSFGPDIENFNHVECKYLTPDTLFTSTCNSLVNVMLFNVRSLRKNFPQFLAYFSCILVHVSFILLTETWLDPDFSDCFSLPGFCKLDLCRNNYGGGVRVFVREDIQTSILSDFTHGNDFIEMLTVKCLRNGVNFVVSLIYHPPSPSHVLNNMFVEYLLSLLTRMKSLNIPIIIGGDMNLNLLNPHNFGFIDSFINGMLSLDFLPVINIPTKINAESAISRYSILDQIWVSGNLVPSHAFAIPIDITDHLPV